MYGVGCLNNIASLAHESDEAKALVHCNVYKPFLESVRHYPTGLIVHVMSHRDQPLSFWREMMKELMHSMSMSMVREKAVMNFVERLQRDVPHTNVWLELRKGYNTYMDSDGDLLIFRDKVLQIEGGYRQSTKQGRSTEKVSDTACGMEALKLDAVDTDNISLACGESVHIASWQISCGVFDNTHASWMDMVAEAREVHILPSPRELLEQGNFAYLLPLDLCIDEEGGGRVVHLKRHQNIKRPTIPVTALHGMDSKMRQGLPFLVPSPSVYSPLDSKQMPSHVVRLTYIYKPV
jgi:hypothetical protein